MRRVAAEVLADAIVGGAGKGRQSKCRERGGSAGGQAADECRSVHEEKIARTRPCGQGSEPPPERRISANLAGGSTPSPPCLNPWGRPSTCSRASPSGLSLLMPRPWWCHSYSLH